MIKHETKDSKKNNLQLMCQNDMRTDIFTIRREIVRRVAD
ncbi:hypothetical protein BN439_1145 [Erwinia amylovora Ea644]|nr:hypothetical protein BN439_1145 [Erwinia amylovora Ea644]